MPKLFLFIAFILATTISYSQSTDNAYGPVPTREFIRSTGETYILLPLDNFNIKQGYNSFHNKDGLKLSAADAGKKLVLHSAEHDEKAFFKDSLGNEFDTHVSGYQVYNIVSLNDYIAAKKLFLNKTLWLNANEIRNGNPLDLLEKKVFIEGLRFDPVIITEITLSWDNNAPFVFHVKTAKGQTGYIETSVSGTNTNRLPENLFSTHFFEKDPKTRYHFTPAVWKMVKAGYTAKGMPMEAFILVTGNPAHINHMGNRTQLVYGSTSPTYYYFENGKLVN